MKDVDLSQNISVLRTEAVEHTKVSAWCAGLAVLGVFAEADALAEPKASLAGAKMLLALAVTPLATYRFVLEGIEALRTGQRITMLEAVHHDLMSEPKQLESSY